MSFAASCSDANGPEEGARYTFRETLTSDLVRVEITDPDALADADDLLRSGGERWVLGTIRRGDGGFNTGWPWHLEPATVSFAEITIEACQTRASAIADDLDYWIEFGQVCIWGTVAARER